MINKWLSSLPSTNAVIACGMLIATFTAARYILSGVHIEMGIGTFGFAAWTPVGEWLLFVAAMLGIGTTQFAVKRSTSADHYEAKARAAKATSPRVSARTAEVTTDEVTVNEAGQ